MKVLSASTILILLLTSCFLIRPAKVPMPAVYHAAADVNVDGLIVFLPGIGDGPERFDQKGMIDIVRRIAPTYDIVAADAHLAYYQNQSVIDRLHEDIVGPVAHRYQHIWVVGISMGGVGAASYAIEHPKIVEGVILLAPFLGRDELISEVADAGGLRQWIPPELADIDDSEQRQFYRLWRWYKTYATSDPPATVLMLGFGTNDRLSDANQLIADVMPVNRVVTMPGGHKWTVWVPIFESLLQRALYVPAE